ncbi:MAG: DNA repair protein RecN [Coleofasciculaceae cyanobacterium RL_1_1]|nr:DNA repair protein RecN [Coleofasciculaceae cyanobacterium RL_1_1]
MLQRLRIENFALVDQLDLEFGAGLNVLTGETGAGKSIVLDALDAVLGGKTSGRVIRTGTDRALIEATFSRVFSGLGEDDNSGDSGDAAAPSIAPSMVIRRELIAGKRGSRSKYAIDGHTASQKEIQAVRSRYLEIAAQGQSVQLGQTSHQRGLLDLYGGETLIAQRQTVADCYSTWQTVTKKLETRRHSEAQRLQQLDLFAYQIEELRAAELDSPDELDTLLQEASRLNHVVELQRQSYEVYQSLYQADEGSAAADILGTAEATLSEMVEYDAAIAPILELVSDALVRVTEAGNAINAYGDGLEADPERLDIAESRIRQLKQICRKYGPSLANVIDHYNDLCAQVEDLTGGGTSIEELEAQVAALQVELDRACLSLRVQRRDAADRLETRLTAALQPLAMENVQFHVAIEPIAPTASGADRVTFQWSPNPGEPLQSLAATASGGEMSRFLLALKACFSEVDRVETMVFDEIDVGVSGRVASTIAETLYRLSQRHQVLCVTHQPLVAAMADHHYHVDKHIISDRNLEDDDRTVIRVSALNPDDRRLELAQLASGAIKTDGDRQAASDAATAFAASLLTQAATLRQQVAATSAILDSPPDSPPDSPLDSTAIPPDASSKPDPKPSTKKRTASNLKTNHKTGTLSQFLNLTVG